ncbi:hypothetical protein BOX15_Mlig024093g2, partial [Macrostomum lignano]
ATRLLPSTHKADARQSNITMRYVAAYLLASMGGQEPTKDTIKKILGSVGIDCDEERVTKLINEMKGKSIDEVIEAGQKKLASVPSGGGAAAAAAPAAAAPPAAKEEKKEEKKEESESEEDDMGFGLFD